MIAIKCPVCGTIYLGYACPKKEQHDEAIDIPDFLKDIFK